MDVEVAFAEDEASTVEEVVSLGEDIVVDTEAAVEVTPPTRSRELDLLTQDTQIPRELDSLATS